MRRNRISPPSRVSPHAPAAPSPKIVTVANSARGGTILLNGIGNDCFATNGLLIRPHPQEFRDLRQSRNFWGP